MVYGRECGDCETHCRVGLMVYGRECGDCETQCRVGWANGVWSGMWSLLSKTYRVSNKRGVKR